MTDNSFRDEKFLKAIEDVPDDVLPLLQFSVPWAKASTVSPAKKSGEYYDEDGFPTEYPSDDISKWPTLQRQCWKKFNKNPHINTAVRDTMGRLAGAGFSVSSPVGKVQEAIDWIFYDPRNRLWNFLPKFVARSEIEGELFLCVTLHEDGFVEVDFMDPGILTGGGDDGTGVIYHPMKTHMPLMYMFQIQMKNSTQSTQTVAIPSINLAYYPDLYDDIKDHTSLSNKDVFKQSKSSNKFYKDLGGFKRFVISWDKSFLTRRNISHIRTILEWLEYYEALKKYEIDHKKSAGAYLWVAKITDLKTFRFWLGLTDAERQATGLYDDKVPGGTLILPPGMDFQCYNPNLPRISDQDTDILRMVTAGLNKSEDMVTGQNTGSYASVKASRDPQSDRINDEKTYFERFLKFEFFRGLFFLMTYANALSKNYMVKEVTGYKEVKKTVTRENEEGNKITEEIDDMEEVMESKSRPPWWSLEISLPTSAFSNVESIVKAFLGVKHGSVIDTLGIPREEVARAIGFNNYRNLRLRKSTEDKTLPKTLSGVDQESEQEKNEAEPSRQKLKRRTKK